MYTHPYTRSKVDVVRITRIFLTRGTCLVCIQLVAHMLFVYIHQVGLDAVSQQGTYRRSPLRNRGLKHVQSALSTL